MNKEVVKNLIMGSSLLNEYQKDAMVESLHDLPDTTVRKIVEILTDFEVKRHKRESNFLHKINGLVEEYKLKASALQVDEISKSRFQNVFILFGAFFTRLFKR